LVVNWFLALLIRTYLGQIISVITRKTVKPTIFFDVFASAVFWMQLSNFSRRYGRFSSARLWYTCWLWLQDWNDHCSHVTVRFHLFFACLESGF